MSDIDKPMFDTTEEYEVYLNKIVEMIQVRIDQTDEKLRCEEIEVITYTPYGETMSVPNITYYKYDALKKAYADVLTFFDYARMDTPRNVSISEKILNGKL